MAVLPERVTDLCGAEKEPPPLTIQSVRQLTLTRGLVTFVDASDYAWLSQWKWHAHDTGGKIYAARNARVTELGPCIIYMHREIAAPPPGLLTDHWNGNTLDNRRANLRAATHVENGSNRRDRPKSTYRGVRFDPRRKKKPWAVVFQYNRVNHWVGYFADPVEGARAYDKVARKVRGEFAALNFPEAA